jgi:GDP-L-fucose synthase
MSLLGRRVLLTGASGFLGKFVHNKLGALGASVFPVSRRKGYDLRDESRCIQAFKDCNPDVAIHLAARVGGIMANMDAPGTFFNENMKMGMNFINTAHRFNARMVVVGTVCSYPKICPIPFKEEDIWNGYPEPTNAPYGIAKKALLVMLQAYEKEFGLKFAYLIPTNLYGPFDNFDDRTSHVIPAVIKKLIKARKEKFSRVMFFGTGTPTRSFLYVDDAAAAIARAAIDFSSREPINLPGCDETSIKSLVRTIANKIGYKGEICWDPTKPDGQPRRAVDGTRAKELLGWAPSISLDKGIEDTVKWYEAE